MFSETPRTAAVAALIALLPAILRWWWGRALARRLDDPALPERMLANRHRTGVAAGVPVGLLIVGWPGWAYWTLPLLIVARGIAGYPFRKTLYGETWSLTAYLFFFTRLSVATFALWLLLAAGPASAGSTGAVDWVVATGLAVVLPCRNARYSDSVRRLLGSRPVDDPPWFRDSNHSLARAIHRCHDSNVLISAAV
jgi:hypothetical protein